MAKTKTTDDALETEGSGAKDLRYRCITPCTYNGRYYSMGDILIVRNEEVKHICFKLVE
jgi:hypothetical protein